MPVITDFKVGQTASLTKKFEKNDVIQFAEISLDKNPIHLDEKYARQSLFGKPVVHGILQAGLISAVLGNKLPGPGSIYREQNLTFKKPAFIGDTLTATVEIIEIKERIGLLVLKTIVTNQDGLLLIEGIAKGLVQK
ncbi:MAG: MaoC family dehydratase [Candidatus Aureabacteria bacterium]|nr:MaoC family dehydratase [Candidatus Auribacterota bacterium]